MKAVILRYPRERDAEFLALILGLEGQAVGVQDEASTSWVFQPCTVFALWLVGMDEKAELPAFLEDPRYEPLWQTDLLGSCHPAKELGPGDLVPSTCCLAAGRHRPAAAACHPYPLP